MTTRAQELYYESVIAKQNRDAKNPIADAAASGWASGIERGLKSKQEDDSNFKKSILAGGLEKQKQRQAMAAKILETYGIYDADGNPDYSVKSRNTVYQALIDGADTFPGGLTVKPLKEQRSYQTPEEIAIQKEADRQNALKIAGMKGKEEYPAKQITKNPDGSSLTQEGYVEQREIPAIPAIPKKKIFGVPIPFTGSEAVPASVGDVFVPATKRNQQPMQNRVVQPQPQPVVQNQPSQQPVQIDPQDQEAYKWALSNPEDPRSQAILIKLKNKHSR
jgi:hypothetical protein